MTKIKLLLLTVFIQFLVFGQNGTNNSFGAFKGVKTLNSKPIIDNTELNGKFLFVSENNINPIGDILNFSKLTVNGEYKHHLKNKVWNYTFHNVLNHDVNFNDKINRLSQSKANGYKDVFSINYKDDKFNGKNSYYRYKIPYNKTNTPSLQIEINFNNDTLVQAFYIKKDNIFIIGQTDNYGFLNGKLILNYDLNDEKITENRIYQNGFLIQLEKISDKTKDKIIDINYEDVKERLEQVKSNPQNYKVSDKSQYFGTTFSLAYPANHPKRVQQKDGNFLLDKYLSFFDTIAKIHDEKNSTKKSILKLTKRFKFDNDFVNQLKINELHLLCKDLQTDLKNIKNNPKINLRKENSEQLTIIHTHIVHSEFIVSKLINELEKIQSGYFDYRSIENYYSKGIEGLENVIDLKYIYKGKEKTIASDLTKTINSFNQFKENIASIIQDIQDKKNLYEKEIKTIISDFESSELITENEKKLLEKKNLLDNEFDFLSENINISNLSFYAKLYQSYKERIIKNDLDKISNNKISNDEKLILTNQTLCFYDFFIQKKDTLKGYDNQIKEWNDNQYTIYTDNPFDFRPFESKILGGIQQASNTLFKQYTNDMLNEKSCEKLVEIFNKIELIKKRVDYLTKNYNTPKVIELNKALRRERVTARLEKYLEL